MSEYPPKKEPPKNPFEPYIEKLRDKLADGDIGPEEVRAKRDLLEKAATSDDPEEFLKDALAEGNISVQELQELKPLIPKKESATPTDRPKLKTELPAPPISETEGAPSQQESPEKSLEEADLRVLETKKALDKAFAEGVRGKDLEQLYAVYQAAKDALIKSGDELEHKHYFGDDRKKVEEAEVPKEPEADTKAIELKVIDDEIKQINERLHGEVIQGWSTVQALGKRRKELEEKRRGLVGERPKKEMTLEEIEERLEDAKKDPARSHGKSAIHPDGRGAYQGIAPSYPDEAGKEFGGSEAYWLNKKAEFLAKQKQSQPKQGGTPPTPSTSSGSSPSASTTSPPPEPPAPAPEKPEPEIPEIKEVKPAEKDLAGEAVIKSPVPESTKPAAEAAPPRHEEKSPEEKALEERAKAEAKAKEAEEALRKLREAREAKAPMEEVKKMEEDVKKKEQASRSPGFGKFFRNIYEKYIKQPPRENPAHEMFGLGEVVAGKTTKPEETSKPKELSPIEAEAAKSPSLRNRVKSTWEKTKDQYYMTTTVRAASLFAWFKERGKSLFIVNKSGRRIPTIIGGEIQQAEMLRKGTKTSAERARDFATQLQDEILVYKPPTESLKSKISELEEKKSKSKIEYEIKDMDTEIARLNKEIGRVEKMRGWIIDKDQANEVAEEIVEAERRHGRTLTPEQFGKAADIVIAKRVKENDNKIETIVESVGFMLMEKLKKARGQATSEKVLTPERLEEIKEELRNKLNEQRRNWIALDAKSFAKLMQDILDKNYKLRYLYDIIKIAGLIGAVSYMLYGGEKPQDSGGDTNLPVENKKIWMDEHFWDSSQEILKDAGIPNPTNEQTQAVDTVLSLANKVKVIDPATGNAIWPQTAGGEIIDRVMQAGWYEAGGARKLAAEIANGKVVDLNHLDFAKYLK